MELLKRIETYLIDPAILAIFTAAFLLFVFGLVTYLNNLRSGKGHEDGKRHMLWGLVGMLIMVTVNGIIGIIMNTIGVNEYDTQIDRFNNVKPLGKDISKLFGN